MASPNPESRRRDLPTSTSGAGVRNLLPQHNHIHDVPFLTRAICFCCSGKSQVCRFPASQGWRSRRQRTLSRRCLADGPTTPEYQAVQGLRRLQDAQSTMFRYGIYPLFLPLPLLARFLIRVGFPSPCLGCSVSSASSPWTPLLPTLFMDGSDKNKATRHRLLLRPEESSASEKW